MANDPIGLLIERIVSLQRQQDESAWNEIALIATLSKILPGFSQEFARQHSVAEISTPPCGVEELAKLVSALANVRQRGGQ